MEVTFQEYQRFSQSVVTEESMPAYVRATKRLQDLQPFEEKLVSELRTLAVQFPATNRHAKDRIIYS